MATEALELHIEGMLEDREPVPERPRVKAIRINVMLSEDLVQAIDRVTRNRSRFLAEAAKSKLTAST